MSYMCVHIYTTYINYICVCLYVHIPHLKLYMCMYHIYKAYICIYKPCILYVPHMYIYKPYLCVYYLYKSYIAIYMYQFV